MTATVAPPAHKIDVENPATGQIVASVDVVGPERIAELVERARAAQPGWEALGFEARAQVLKRCQRWVVDNSERIIETIDERYYRHHGHARPHGHGEDPVDVAAEAVPA